MKKKSNLILLAVLVLAIGYAAVTTTLNLNGLVSIGENQEDFDVYFSNALEDGVENKKVIKDDTHISFNKELKSVGDTYTLEYDVTNGSRDYDAEVTIDCTKSNDYLKITNDFDSEKNLLATETRRGKLTVEVIKSYVGTEEQSKLDTNISCEISGNAVARNNKATGTPVKKLCFPKVYENGPWKYIDNDCSNDVSKNDIITLDTESFYVLSVDKNYVKAFAQYNLLINGGYNVPEGSGTGLQDKSAKGFVSEGSAIGAVQYDSSGEQNTSYEKSTIKGYVDEYVAKLNELNGQVLYGNLISKRTLSDLGCDSADETGYYYGGGTCKKAPEFVYSTSYWTSSWFTGKYLWAVDSNGTFSPGGHVSIGERYGVRPVVTVLREAIESPKCDKNVYEKGAWKYIDNDCNSDVSVGDLITLGTESFYVYDITGDNIKGLAKYSLLVEGGEDVLAGSGTGLQDFKTLDNSIGAVFFDSSENCKNSPDNCTTEYANSTIKSYVDAYGEKLNTLNGGISEIGLITKEELEVLGCDFDDVARMCFPSPYPWVYSTSYWTSSSYNLDAVWSVLVGGGIQQNPKLSISHVRPVITISKSLFE